MKRFAILVLAAMAIAVALPNGLVYGQTTPAGPTVVSRVSLPSVTMAGEFDATNLILEFAPGATAASHTHGGPGVVIVLEGEITFRVEGKADQVAKVGEVFVDTPGVVHSATNEGSTPARASFMALLPKGATLTSPTGPAPPNAPPGPKVLYRSTMPGLTMAGEFDANNLILEFAPGASAGAHTHGGPGVVIVLDGEITFRTEGKPDQVATAGYMFVDTPGVVHSATNEGSAPAKASFIAVIPKGAALTTPAGGAPAPAQPVAVAAPAGMPSTGSNTATLIPFALLAVVLLSLAVGVLSRTMKSQT